MRVSVRADVDRRSIRPLALHELRSVDHIHRPPARHILQPVPLLKISFEHGLTTRAPERQKLRQEFRGRLLLSFATPELVTLLALRTMEGNWQRRVVNRHVGFYSEAHVSATVFGG